VTTIGRGPAVTVDTGESGGVVGWTTVVAGTAGEATGTVLVGRVGYPVGLRVNVKLAVIMETGDEVLGKLTSDGLASEMVGRGPATPTVSVRVTLVLDVDPMGSVKVTVWLTTAGVRCPFGYGPADTEGRGSVAVPVQTVEVDSPSGMVTRCVVVNQPIPCGFPVAEWPVGSNDFTGGVGLRESVTVMGANETETGPGPVGSAGKGRVSP